MKTRREVVEACLGLPFSYEDYPFDDKNWTAVRHQENRRIFALIFEREGRIWVNLKADPMYAELWKELYSSVIEGYHMNKRHWISVILDGKMEEEDTLRLIEDSYRLTLPESRRRKKK